LVSASFPPLLMLHMRTWSFFCASVSLTSLYSISGIL
jgi:hypothetical protein